MDHLYSSVLMSLSEMRVLNKERECLKCLWSELTFRRSRHVSEYTGWYFCMNIYKIIEQLIISIKNGLFINLKYI